MSLVYIAAKPIGGQPLPDLAPLISIWDGAKEDLFNDYKQRLELQRAGRQIDIYRITPPVRTGISCGYPDCHCTQDVQELMISFSLDAEDLQMDLGDPMPAIRLRAFSDVDAANDWLAAP